MKTIKITEIENEILKILEITKNHKLIRESLIEKLEQEGFEYIQVGTSPNCYICSKEIKIIDSRKNRVYCNSKLLLTLGIANITAGKGHIYRGYAKEIESTEVFSNEDVKELQDKISNILKKYQN